jgi:hypothetical protein
MADAPEENLTLRSTAPFCGPETPEPSGAKKVKNLAAHA